MQPVRWCEGVSPSFENQDKFGDHRKYEVMAELGNCNDAAECPSDTPTNVNHTDGTD